MTEKELEEELCTRIGFLGGMAVKLVLENGRGFPDRTILFAGRPALFVEVKKPGGRLSKHQERWIERLRNTGYRVDVISTVEELDEWQRDALT